MAPALPNWIPKNTATTTSTLDGSPKWRVGKEPPKRGRTLGDLAGEGAGTNTLPAG